MGRLIEETIQSFFESQQKCKLHVDTKFKNQITIYTGYIKDFDGKFIRFLDKYGTEITIVCSSIMQIVAAKEEKHEQD